MEGGVFVAKKAYINQSDSESFLSDYLVRIEYQDGEVFDMNVSNYSYTRVFEAIQEKHEGEYDRAVKSIVIEFIM